MGNATKDMQAVAVMKGLIMDATRKANSGHPGGAMGMADMGYILFKEFLNYSPDNPEWFNRDRFVLSAGHASMLLYSLLTFVGYLSLEDLKQFRQWGSRTPGHPEYGLAPGVEATTGPLGQGVGMATGMAIAERILNAHLGNDMISHYTYVLASDGDFQEPVGLGNAALAGHLGLGKLIVFYDYNEIQISGSTHRADSTDYRKVFEGFHWQVLEIDGHDHQAIRQAVEEARRNEAQPSLILAHTTIARGSCTMEGNAETHGAPLPEEEIRCTKEKLGLPPDETFYLPETVLNHFRARFPELREMEARWNNRLQERQQDDAFRKLWERFFSSEWIATLEEPQFEPGDMLATRSAFGKTLAAWAEAIPNLVGGSADLEPSNNTRAFMEKVGDFTKDNRHGRNLVFGVREFPMGTILNGMALHGGLRPFGATFLVFSDYERAAIRLSALQHLPVLHVFTHDSVFLGEDGPTHQPIEHLASLRAMPNLLVLRPSDAAEVPVAMKVALEQNNRPTILALTRQKLPVLTRTVDASPELLRKGAYVILPETGEELEVVILATGSEVSLAVDAAQLLSDYAIRVVAMPSWELFEEQPDAYKQAIIPPHVPFKVAVEAASPFGWERYVEPGGLIIALNRFGASAPAKVIAEKLGFTPEAIAERIRQWIKSR